jgi:hypothetical protein
LFLLRSADGNTISCSQAVPVGIGDPFVTSQWTWHRQYVDTENAYKKASNEAAERADCEQVQRSHCMPGWFVDHLHRHNVSNCTESVWHATCNNLSISLCFPECMGAISANRRQKITAINQRALNFGVSILG